MSLINKDLIENFQEDPKKFIKRNGHVNIPFGITNVHTGAFSECLNAKHAIIPNSVIKLDKYAFTHCVNLKDVVIPNSVGIIDQCAFFKCQSLKKIDIPASVKEIGFDAFSICSNLKQVNIADGVENIVSRAFSYCRSLKNIIIPDSVTNLGSSAFQGCYKLKNTVIGSGVTKIKSFTFDYCKNLESVTMSNNVTIIDDCAFTKCFKLKNITIPESVISIGRRAFWHCEKLQDIVIPESVKIIGEDAFKHCKKLKQITMCGEQINISDIKAMNVDVADYIREYFYVNKYAKQLKPFMDKRIYIPVDIIQMLVSDNTIDTKKTFNCKHLCNELDCIFKNDEKLLQDFEQTELQAQINFYKLAHKIGAFSNDKILAQKASSVMASLLKDKTLKMMDFYKFFDQIDFADKNTKVYEFLSSKNKNLPDIIELERMYPKILLKVINNYDAFLERKTILDNSGKPKKLSLKEAAIKLYNDTVYNNITPDNRHIADEFAKFSLTQSDFNKALKLKKQSDQSINILKNEFNERSLIEQIEDVKNDTENKIISAQILAKEFLEKKFTYEILNKQDPRNLILGAYCSCCANIKSANYGQKIAISSFTSSNVDNIVVKNTEGMIIAKGTIYVNRKDGYGVLNDFELNDRYKKDGFKTEDKQLIFNTFKRAINSFVDTYNNENQTPITKVNVGLGYNRLAEYTKELPKEKKLLSVPEKYGFNDASKDQYIIYKAQEKLEKSQ